MLLVACGFGMGRQQGRSGKQAIVLEEFVFMKSPTRDCHASSIMELSDGTLLCTWFGGTRERAKDVKIWLARKPKGGTWQELWP